MNGGRPVIVDVDGVLADFATGFNRALTLKGPVTVPDHFKPENWYWKGAHVKRGQIAGTWDYLKVYGKDFWRSLLPYDDAMSWLVRDKHDTDIYLVTSRSELGLGDSALRQTMRWVDEKICAGLNLPVIVTKTSRGKMLVAKAIGAVAAIDDYPPNVRKINANGSCVAYLRDQPWNRDAKDLDGVRVKSAEEFWDKAVQ